MQTKQKCVTSVKSKKLSTLFQFSGDIESQGMNICSKFRYLLKLKEIVNCMNTDFNLFHDDN